MDALAWNGRFHVGTPVIVTLANRKRLLARTVCPAVRIGHHDLIEVDQIRPGYILLAWCWPIRGNALRLLTKTREGPSTGGSDGNRN